MSKPAARVGEIHTCPGRHTSGPILPPGNFSVFISGMPAATVGDMLLCSDPPESIAAGSTSVLIGNKPAARMLDKTTRGGKILTGALSVLVGG